MCDGPIPSGRNDNPQNQPASYQLPSPTVNSVSKKSANRPFRSTPPKETQKTTNHSSVTCCVTFISPKKARIFTQRVPSGEGQIVRVVTHREDRYGRTIGDVFLKDVPRPNVLPGAVLPDWNINLEIVQEGLALHFKKYSSDINREMDEVTARDRKLELWSDVCSIPPWEWRKSGHVAGTLCSFNSVNCQPNALRQRSLLGKSG